MKRLFVGALALSMAMFATNSYAAKMAKPKYVFFFIGDGMGAASMYSAQRYLTQKGDDGLTMVKFPYSGMMYTNSESSEVTDSAAAGTALATGVKTSNGTLGMRSNHTDTLESMAYMAKKAGRAIGLVTSVSIDHATPAAFFAHQPRRSMYYEVALDGADTGFDLYAGSGFLRPTVPDVINAYQVYKNSGYTILEGVDGLDELDNQKGKVLIKERQGADNSALRYEIDATDKDLSLPDITEESIEYLEQRAGKKGFFMMVEGGKIDWANHSNDYATSLQEVLAFDQALAEAYEFYKENPNNTLIVVTADHETGGQSITTDDSKADFTVIDRQKVSKDVLEAAIKKMQTDGKSWDDMRAYLDKNLGLWSTFAVSLDQEYAMRKAYGDGVFDRADYTSEGGKVATIAIEIVNKAAGIEWTSFGHTAVPVPIYSIGVGAENFKGVMDNTELSKKLIQILK